MNHEEQNKKSIHPWRHCPYGEHWVKEHELHVPESLKNPNGNTTIRHAHCAKNPSKKDSLYLDEIHEIANQFFKPLTGPPNSINLGFPNGNNFDEFIRGWTKYWNDIFNPNIPLDPDIIKALIASESGFKIEVRPQNTKSAGKARGLIQLTDQARKILRDTNGELKDHFIYLNQTDLNDPNASICAGIRWLFQKQRLASNRLNRPSNWEEAIAEYKGYLKDIISGKNPSPTGMKNFNEALQKLKSK